MGGSSASVILMVLFLRCAQHSFVSSAPHLQEESQLTIKVKEDASSPDEDAFSEIIYANVTEDLVFIAFTSPDGTKVTLANDFKKVGYKNDRTFIFLPTFCITKPRLS